MGKLEQIGFSIIMPGSLVEVEMNDGSRQPLYFDRIVSEGCKEEIRVYRSTKEPIKLTDISAENIRRVRLLKYR